MKIIIVIILNLIITISEVIGGLLSKSLSLLSDSFHNLNDTIAIILTLIANKISKKQSNIKKTFGYKRSEIIVAFLNSTILIIISISLIIESIKRFKNPPFINSNSMLIIAIIGFFGNLISIIVLKKDSEKNLNIRSSFLHLFGDTFSSIGVILGAILIKFFNIYIIDPLVTILISLYIIKEAIDIVLKTINILMQSSPELNFEDLKNKIEKIENVRNIHHLHCWMINEYTIYFEAHIDVNDMKVSEIESIYMKIEKILTQEYNINHITIQPEVNRCFDKNLINSNKN